MAEVPICIYPTGYSLDAGELARYGAGHRYTSMTSMEAGEDLDWVSATDNPVIEILGGDGSTNWGTVGSDSGPVSFSGWTLSATYPATMTTLGTAIHDGKWTTTAYRLSAATASAVISMLVSDFTITGLQVDCLTGGRTGVLSTGDEVLFDKCIIRLDNTYGSAYCMNFGGSGTNNYMKNSLCYGYGSGGATNGILADNGTAYVYNTTVVDIDGIGFFASSDGTLNLKNDIAFAIGGTEYNATGTINADYCGYEDSDPGTNGVDLSSDAGTDLFLDYNNDDFHTKNNTCTIFGAGTDLSGDPNLPVTEGIDGNARVQYDLGCDEFVGGGVIYDMSATCEIAIEGSAGISALIPLSGVAQIAVEGSANITALQSLLASGDIGVAGSADIAAIVSISATGEIAVQGSAALAGVFGLSANGEIAAQGQAILNIIANMVASGEIAVEGRANLTFAVAFDGTLSRIFGEVDLFKINGVADLLTISGEADLTQIGGEVDY